MRPQLKHYLQHASISHSAFLKPSPRASGRHIALDVALLTLPVPRALGEEHCLDWILDLRLR
jgi:hypothetical protein